jgi:hypothetical protein
MDRRGPYLGLGATYFSALRHARSDRARLHADLDLLRSKGFNYVRVLSMVGWYPFWQGLEIAPSRRRTGGPSPPGPTTGSSSRT